MVLVDMNFKRGKRCSTVFGNIHPNAFVNIHDFQVHHDTTAPLQHYFIYTGHNSYLTGNQFNSDCSEVPIIKALLKGVRVIELDLWPNSAKDGIHVLHGCLMLGKCLKSIREHAFVNSHYPVIITLEDHLTPNLRTKVAEMATEILGDMLYCPKAGDNDEFPSPEELKHRIILSTKPPKECLESNKLEEELIAEDETPCICENTNPSDETQIGSNQEGNVSNLNQNLSEFLRIDSEDGDAANKKPGQKTPREYIQIIGIHAAKANKELRQALEVGSGKGKRISVSEQTLEKAAEDYGSDLVRFTQKNFVRVFPTGTRVTSSNCKPLLAWMHGAQMVASYMQGYGKSLWMMHGMFRSNGGCGF
ncbi:putative phosphoinositide phospholipase C [Helianthus anomalus]